MTNLVKVKFKKLNKKAVIPAYAHPDSAGMDLVAVTKEETDKYIQYGLGFATEIPKGYVGLVFPNSRISKYDVSLANCVAVFDSDYRGEWMLRFKKYPKFHICTIINKFKGWFGIKDFTIESYLDQDNTKIYQIGDVVAQLIVIPYPKVEIVEVEELTDSERGTGGFGSTEKQNLVEAPTETPKKKRTRKKKNE